PALQTARVTREIANHLAELGKSFEAQKHGSEKVARFLMRSLFTMFAEDVELIPKGSFTKTLKELRGHPEHAKPTLEGLWEVMNHGGFSQILMTDLLRFNGGLFKDAEALPLDAVQLSLLIEAAEADWRQVEPAIFGTLLERALDKKQRHKLGAHYTPRTYVERLVVPTIMEPLRSDWKDIQAAALTLAGQGQQNEAINTVRAFRDKLCSTRVLDPACGSGNFLYVAMEMMKRLEGEVSALLEELGYDQLDTITVDPEQFLGLELNEWAVAVAELVLWIGYLQWHFRTFGKATPAQPVLKDFDNIKNVDAVLTWRKCIPRVGEDGEPVTRWDGVTTITHNVTGEEVPDPNARIQVFDYSNPKPTKWPEAEFIIGNPPFIGNKRMRENLGDGYVEALWKVYPKVPQSADLVMFWWEKAAQMACAFNAKTGQGTRRFGLITTNSLRQTFNRRVLEPHLNSPKKPLSLLFAIPDHPWVDTLFGAAVRIAMTVASIGNRTGRLQMVLSESNEGTTSEGQIVHFEQQVGKIFANLQTGANVALAKPLRANSLIAYQGVIPGGLGYKELPTMTAERSFELSQLGLVKRYINGRNLLHGAEPERIIDFFGHDEISARATAPELFQVVIDKVKPLRDIMKRKSRREKYWLYSEPNSTMRPMMTGIDRYIATCRTAKHRIFSFLDADVLPDAKIIAIGVQSGHFLSILSSKYHVAWSIASGGWLGVGNDANYNHAQCFYPYPFPDLTDDQHHNLEQLGEELDAYRKHQQDTHPNLTLTQMYNVLEKLRAGDVIEGKDKEIYDQGLIGILLGLHDLIDAAVADAYGWPQDLSNEGILRRLVDLNQERAKEEAAGRIRWLRPEYQNPTGQSTQGKTKEMDLGTTPLVPDIIPWPKILPGQIAAVREALAELEEASAAEIARQFKGAGEKRVLPLLESLVAIGQADVTKTGRFVS
ncbi:class I SAM-dependent DNA methyltransferase, partial [Alphaproteobacteria bacterium]|nr:class I SAM-dependent DNA methyltransferase [Alphaproteobacteria bacterium]